MASWRQRANARVQSAGFRNYYQYQELRAAERATYGSNLYRDIRQYQTTSAHPQFEHRVRQVLGMSNSPEARQTLMTDLTNPFHEQFRQAFTTQEGGRLTVLSDEEARQVRSRKYDTSLLGQWLIDQGYANEGDDLSEYEDY